MIQCKKCGAQLDINTEVCPYCQTVNEEAREHIKKIKHFEKDYAKVKKAVFANVKTYSKGYGSLALLIILLLSSLISLFVLSSEDAFRDAATLNYYHDNQSQINERIDTYLLNEDYEKLAEYLETIEYNGYIEELSPYRQLISMTSYYQRIKANIADYLYDARAYDNELSDLASNISYFYSTAQADYYGNDFADVKKRLTMSLEKLLRHYGHFTDDDIAKLNAKVDEITISKMVYERMLLDDEK